MTKLIDLIFLLPKGFSCSFENHVFPKSSIKIIVSDGLHNHSHEFNKDNLCSLGEEYSDVVVTDTMNYMINEIKKRNSEETEDPLNQRATVGWLGNKIKNNVIED